ncbi:MAG TPA: hypothetical protein VMB21_21125, partial [Candidatus Limnocylindria bacterium]|nr:hypothetical protein [Candidatus Limnocylindria bacterium]
SAIGLIVASLAWWLACRNSDLSAMGLTIPRYLPGVLAPLLVLLFSNFAKNKIEDFLHYQRLREVFFVLETAFTAFRERYYLLSPPLSKAAVKKLNEMNSAE